MDICFRDENYTCGLADTLGVDDEPGLGRSAIVQDSDGGPDGRGLRQRKCGKLLGGEGVKDPVTWRPAGALPRFLRRKATVHA